MGDGWLVALGGLIVVVVGALTQAAVALYNSWHRSNQESKKTSTDEFQAIIAQLREQIRDLQAEVKSLTVANAVLQKEGTSWKVGLERIWSWMTRFHELAQRLTAGLKRLKEDPGEVPTLPSRDDIVPGTTGPIDTTTVEKSAAQVVQVGQAALRDLAKDKGAGEGSS